MFDVSGDGEATQSEFLAAAQAFQRQIGFNRTGKHMEQRRAPVPITAFLYVFAFSISGFIFLWQDGVFAVIEFAAPSLKPGGGSSRRSPFLVLYNG